MLSLTDIPLRSAPFAWFVVGGWALDLYLGRETRPHADLDLGVFRRDQKQLRDFLSEWNVQKNLDGVSYPWEMDEELRLPVHEIHATHEQHGQVEILFSESSDTDWIYRRDDRITCPLDNAIILLANGLRILAPQLVLLFKSKSPKPKDHADFESTWPSLTSEQREWLSNSLNSADPLHRWLARLRG